MGAQILYRPERLACRMLSNDYYGHDWLGIPDRWRMHTDNSVQVKYFDQPNAPFDKGAFSLTIDAGCERGGGVSCTGGGEQPEAELPRLHAVQPQLV